MAKSFVRAPPLLNTCGFIPERNYINALNVAKPSARASALLIREVILRINLISVMNAGKPLIRVHASCSIREFIQERSPMYVTNVVKPSLRTRPLLNMRELTLERNFIVNVKKLSAGKHNLVNVMGFILEKRLMCVLNVGNPSGTVLCLSDIRSFMPDNKIWDITSVERLV